MKQKNYANSIIRKNENQYFLIDIIYEITTLQYIVYEYK